MGAATLSAPTLVTPRAEAEAIGSQRYTRLFTQLDRAAVAIAGGKGANLGELTKAGLPVPPGFVVTVSAYTRALDAAAVAERLKAALDHLDVDDPQALQAAAKSAQETIRSIAIPDDVRREILTEYVRLSGETTDAPVAVRSSATAEDAASASFAGMFESYLSVRGTAALLERVRDCWASAFGARVLFYRAKQGLTMEMPVAVVVQRMIASEKSGVIFTVNPATHDSTAIVIEASWGLGEPVVQGQVTPDRYIVDKRSLGVRELKVATKQFVLAVDTRSGGTQRVDFNASDRVLTDAELTELARLALHAESHFGVPQDLEFAIDSTGVYLTQTRPITTLSPTPTTAAVSVSSAAPADVIVRGLGASPGIASGRVRVLADVAAGATMQQGEILVAHMTTPDWVPLMRRAAAIVTDAGGMTSHAAIVSRELGVPCVVGTHDATRVLQQGRLVSVDGNAGTVAAASELPPASQSVAETASPRQLAAPAAEPSVVTSTRLYVNLADPGQAEAVAARDVDGIGLLRAEFMLLEALGGAHPKKLLAEGKRDEIVTRLADSLERIARAFHPRPVIYRAMDFRSNEFRALQGGEEHEPVEANPMIGYRGCYRYIQDRELFGVELLGLYEARSAYDNLHLMIPFVRTEWELRACLDMVNRSRLRRCRGMQRWVMAEVPSIIWRIPDYARLGVTGLSIGTNDLTQLILGVDRDNERLAALYDERDDAVLAAIREIISRAHQARLTVSICGQAPSIHPEYAEFLVRCGIDSISVTADVIERTRRNIARAELRQMLKHAREE